MIVSDRLEWEVEHLKKESKNHGRRLDGHDKDLSELKSFKDSTVEKLISIFKSIEDLHDENRWTRRTLITTLIGGIVTVLGSIIIWLIQT